MATHAQRVSTGAALIEVLVAFVIVLLLTMLGFDGLRTSLHSFQSLSSAAVATDELASAQRFLRRTIASAQRVMTPVAGGGHRVFFHGSANKLSFITRLARHTDPGQLYRLDLSVTAAAHSYVLMADYSRYLPVAGAMDTGKDGDQQLRSVEILRSPQPLAFSYRADDARISEASWQDSWHRQTYLPGMVRVDTLAQDSSGEPAVARSSKRWKWSPIIVATRYSRNTIWPAGHANQ